MHTRNVNDLLPRLQRWYHSQCDSDWEHGNGVKIGTLDNPGWSLEVNLKSTELADRSFSRIDRGLDPRRQNHDWFTCYVEGHRFKGFGGPDKLAELIAVFLEWAGAA